MARSSIKNTSGNCEGVVYIYLSTGLPTCRPTCRLPAHAPPYYLGPRPPAWPAQHLRPTPIP